MATPKSKKIPTTAVATWDEELARQAELAAGMEASTSTGQFFSLRGGQLSWNDAPLPGNQMAVVILDAVLENVFYEGAYDPDTPQGPTCFAFGRDDKTMSPHPIVVEANNSQAGTSGLCAGCEMNEFGSADTGRGKACRNTRRLAMIPAGSFDHNGKLDLIEDPDHYATTAIGYMKLPVTSVKGYAAFVKQVAGALRRPPHGIVARVKVVPDPSSQFKVVFEPLISLPNELMAPIMDRHEEAKGAIEFPYQLNDESAPPPPKRGAKAAKPRGRKY